MEGENVQNTEDENTMDMEVEVEEESNGYEIEIYSTQYGIEFPLPPHEDESLCRDQFLRTLFEYSDKEELISRKTVSSEVISRRRRTGTIGPFANAEAMAIIQMIRGNQKAVEFQENTEFKVTLTAAEKKIIYEKFIVEFQKGTIEYLSVRLKKRLQIFKYIWPGENTKIPYNLFHWSLEHFLARSRINQLYLDVLTIEKTANDLNCAKFCIDVEETIRLLDAIRNDIITDSDLCNGSIALMNAADYGQNAPWVLDLDKNRDLRAKLALQVFSQHSGKDRNIRESVTISPNKRHDAYMPIELRYRINWIRNNGEQHFMWMQSKENDLQKELDVLTNQMKEDSLAREFREFISQYEIDKFRVSIVHWEEKLEVDLEAIELKCNILRNLCAKAKDDLKYSMDQVEMFKKRVAQVQMQDRELERAKHNSSRRSTRIMMPLKKNNKVEQKRKTKISRK